jgi:hypothetical protein
MTSKETASEVVDVLGIVAFLHAAITGMASAGSQAHEKAYPKSDGCAPVISLDHAEAHGLTQILGVLDIKLTAIAEAHLGDEPDGE